MKIWALIAFCVLFAGGPVCADSITLAEPAPERRGTVSGAVVGALIMASLDNGMSLLNVENYTQYIVKGAVLVAAVGFDMLGRRKS